MAPRKVPADLKYYTLHVHFRSAKSLPVGDLLTLSSDPYIAATLRFPNSQFQKLHYRTTTLRRTCEPHWDEEWTVTNVPSTGIRLKLKIIDEDFGDHDDTLGVGYVDSKPPPRSETQSREQTAGLSIRKGADWVALLRLVTGGLSKRNMKHLAGEVLVGIRWELLDDWTPPLERAYTIGPNWWSQHFSPLIGFITHTTDSPNHSTSGIQHYTFAATKIQLTGPLPKILNNRYVAFRPVIKTFYTKSGIRGRILNRALKHQYRTIYSYDKATTRGVLEGPSAIAQKFLEVTGWGTGGRVYTYVVTLDAEWRFTETGKEFGIQMLSKHTMHSCVSIYVAFAGEFFVRPRSDLHRKPREGHRHDYELVIDNDSGTYRPPKDRLSALKEFLERNLHGLRIVVKDAFEEGHHDAKVEHAKEKERAGRRRFKQPSISRGSSPASLSSSDEEELRGGKIGLKGRLKNKAWEALEKESIDSSDDEVQARGRQDEGGTSKATGKDEDDRRRGKGKEKLEELEGKIEHKTDDMGDRLVEKLAPKATTTQSENGMKA